MFLFLKQQRFNAQTHTTHHAVQNFDKPVLMLRTSAIACKKQLSSHVRAAEVYIWEKEAIEARSKISHKWLKKRLAVIRGYDAVISR